MASLIYPFLMNPTEYAKLAEVEELHWYYAGKRELVRYWLNIFGPPRSEQVLLDCGAGTGRFAQEMEASCRVLVLDDHKEALELLRKRFRSEQVIALGAEGVPLPDGSVDYVTALDVLEHIEDDRAAVRDMHRVLKPGGVLLVTVPASMALWSDWDEVLHHHRRYDRAQLKGLFAGPEWELLHVNYTNVLAYPAIWLVRRWRRWFPAKTTSERAEDKVPSRWVNRLLRQQFTALARLRLPVPFGVSLVLAARKPRD